ncbi:hypothetical protein TPHA_0H01670 [Tetrapisispora phaffii CBS 4417]|uniref:Glycosyl transferase family 3 domain-containing protein n=1 Tax=Tetrapisispora phaffii (strain ATCC 24235 / CBS 4417 / NBRC 1672 / NRRL Y-8282 / UCD 70-5) TaxID=1071381 RepID=G8BX69_TETPH|nr:hypothetical protein TPHA_0H01670 [Tetrapisispora phaffii CBS 4417]CCE64373.1 hypothetical protein TPHA_0H01670 [Tetrapisispora phaffii CBS 4417]
MKRLQNRIVIEKMGEQKLVSYTKKLLLHPPTLTPSELYDAISLILGALEKHDGIDLSDESMLKEYVQISSFLTSLRTTGLDHKAEYISKAAEAVVQHSDLVNPDTLTGNITKDCTVLDIVGTGGDGQNTFNVSTSAAIIASGIPNIKVCKHGGKASTSNSGAGDLINQLGCDSSKLNAQSVPKIWNDEKNTFIFLLAPYFHNGMKYAANIRKILGIPTIFNVLGPLLHPVNSVNKRVLGVFSKELAPEYARAAKLVYPNSEVFVVWGHVGLDEVSPIGKTTVWHVGSVSDEIESFDLEPSMFGLQEHDLSECVSLGPKENAVLLRDEILSGKYKLGDNHPIYDYIILNTAVLWCLSQSNRDWKKGIEIANESIQSGSALRSLDYFITSVQNM